VPGIPTSPIIDVVGSIQEIIPIEANNATYSFYVTAYNSIEEGPPSGTASIKISDWEWGNPSPNGNAIRGFAWNGSNLFVAVGDGGSLYTSPDGVSWTIKNSSTVRNLSGVASDGNQFVAVGGNGTILFSSDGAEWTVESGAWASLNDVAWNGTYFVTVGDNGTIFTSPDGKTWTEQTSNFPGPSGRLSRIKWLDSQFVAVGISYSAGAGVILTSPDGITWTSQSCGTTEIEDVAWNNGSIFLATAGSNNICTSSDGVTWTAETTTNYVNTTSSALAWDGSQFILAGQNSQVYTSPDGYNWTSRSPEPGNFNQHLHAILWNGSQYVSGGNAGTILSGPDMTDWPIRSPDYATLLDLYDVVSDGTQFIAVGGGFISEGTIVTSANGVTWTESQTVNARLQGIAWNETDQFVAVGYNDTILTSPDGGTWTNQTSGTTGKTFKKAIWDGNKYVVVGSDVILTSSNGTTWAQETIDDTSTADEITSVTWNGSIFVAVGSDYFPLQGFVWTSADGTNWTRVIQSFGRLDDVAWGNGTFVATGAIGNSYTSADGLTWTSHSIGTSGYMTFVEWDGTQFVGGVPSGYGETLYTSPDGVTWTPLYTFAEIQFLNSITWDNSGKAVIVGFDGSILYNDFW